MHINYGYVSEHKIKTPGKEARFTAGLLSRLGRQHVGRGGGELILDTGDRWRR